MIRHGELSVLNIYRIRVNEEIKTCKCDVWYSTNYLLALNKTSVTQQQASYALIGL